MTTTTGSNPAPAIGRGDDLRALARRVARRAWSLWPLLVLAAVVLLTSDALRRVRIDEVGAALGRLDFGWLGVALLATLVNIAVLGFYDVVVFRGAPQTGLERWQYGAVSFAWSNFLTLGPLAGPALRFWLYRPALDDPRLLRGGIAAIAIAFAAGLAGWIVAAVMLPSLALPVLAAAALVISVAAVLAISAAARRLRGVASMAPDARTALGAALVGWLDWLLAALVFLACAAATGTPLPLRAGARLFFLGQAVGLGSLIPGGLGTADAFWLAQFPLDASVAGAALVAYRTIYYLLPWAAASLVLLAWATHRQPRRVEIARRIAGGLVGLGGVLILASVAVPAMHERLVLLSQVVPLPLVEVGDLGAALSGLLLLMLARGLMRGYRAALRVTVVLLALAGVFALLKGLDWEEAAVLSAIATAVWSQAPIFDRPSHGRWLERSDFGIAVAALLAFLFVGGLAHRVTNRTFERWTRVGYQIESTRFVRTGAVLVLALGVAGLYVLLRVPMDFESPSEDAIERALRLHGRYGRDSALQTVGNGDKQIFFDGDRGLCLLRTIGPYLVVFSDPAVAEPGLQVEFLDRLFRWAREIDRRVIFYQVSLNWIAPLHDRGYAFFKLGEEAILPLERVTLEGHAGKMYRQILRRGERDGLQFDVLPPSAVGDRMPELAEVSSAWLQAKRMTEGQFSVGFFDEEYLRRFPCAIVSDRATGQIVAFANLLQGAERSELSVDLMRHRDTPIHGVMDFLFVSLFFHAQAEGYARFNLGMAPLARVGDVRGAHYRERLAGLLFRHGEGWYNFQGLRAYKDKFSPDWIPRYMAYPAAWEWAAAVTHVTALIGGGWAATPVGRLIPGLLLRRSTTDRSPDGPRATRGLADRQFLDGPVDVEQPPAAATAWPHRSA